MASIPRKNPPQKMATVVKRSRLPVNHMTQRIIAQTTATAITYKYRGCLVMRSLYHDCTLTTSQKHVKLSSNKFQNS